MKKFKVLGVEYFDTYVDSYFDEKVFDALEEAKKYIEDNKVEEGTVGYKTVRKYKIIEEEC